MSTLDHLEAVQEYAQIRRGEHPAYELGSDRIENGENFAWQIGYDFPEDAPGLIQSLHDSETEYSKLTGLPPRSLGIMASCIRRGLDQAKREIKQGART